MADLQQLAKLLQDVDAWNTWRRVHPQTPADLHRADLHRADLHRANLSGADLSLADLSLADLNGANLFEAILNGANLNETNLNGANLSYADLQRATLSRANLNETTLTRANLSYADLQRATLSGADLSYADLSGATLTATDMTNARVGGTHFADLDLHTVKGLETLVHGEPSHISITTLYRSEGQIPDNFLRQAGVPEDFLLYLPGLVNRAIEYYTCFISYTKEDEEFARRLYADLQANGVRCWFAPHDLKIGDRYQERIFQSIRRYDKLLLILSERSIKSAWVQAEVTAALQKEEAQKRAMLFPVRLEESVLQSLSLWKHNLQVTHHIGDFTRWKDHDAYQLAFHRLLRDLQASKPRPGKRTSRQ